MAVRLEGTIKRWIGESTDTKPTEGVPPGSNFLETDTGRIYRWDSSIWTVYVPADSQVVVLDAIHLELMRTRIMLERALGIDTDDLIPD